MIVREEEIEIVDNGWLQSRDKGSALRYIHHGEVAPRTQFVKIELRQT